MTVSMFDSYLERMSLHRAERMMDMGQAALYAQATTEGKTKIWNSWAGVVSSINNWMLQNDASASGQNPLLWNGRAVSIKGLMGKFVSTFGRKSVSGGGT